MIYELVLGRHHYHVHEDLFDPKGRPATHVCATMSSDDARTSTTNFASNVQQQNTGGVYQQLHPACSSERPDLALLRTCTLFHSEAALLPFNLNAFTFDGYPAMCQFLNNAYGQQVAALDSATLVYYPRIPPPRNTGNPKAWQRTTNPHVWKLKNLKNLTILVEADPISLCNVASVWTRYDKQLRKDLRLLQRIDFDTLAIVGYRTNQPVTAQQLFQRGKRLRALRATCTELQKTLATKWSAEYDKKLMRVKWLKDRLKPKNREKVDDRREVEEKLAKAEEALECHAPA